MDIKMGPLEGKESVDYSQKFSRTQENDARDEISKVSPQEN